MSYILDALKKSEQERQQGRVPDLTSAPIIIGQAAGGTVSRRPYYVAALVLLAVAGTLIWWHPWQSSTQTEPTVVPVAPARPPVPNAAPVVPDLHVDLPVALPRAANPSAAGAMDGKPMGQGATATTHEPDVMLRPARSATADSTRGEAELPLEANRRTEPIPSSVLAAPYQAPAAPVPRAAPTTPPAALSAAVPASMPSVQPLPAAAAKGGSGKPAGTTAANGAPSLADVPAAVRKSVARIDVAGFSYSDDPQARMAVINDRILHEGDEVVPGVRLEKIGSDGIVLSHKGIRFRP